MRRVRGDREAISSRTNSCGIGLRCLTGKKGTSSGREEDEVDLEQDFGMQFSAEL